MPFYAAETITTLIAALTGAMPDLLPDFTVYAATAVVIGMAVVVLKRVVKGLR